MIILRGRNWIVIFRGYAILKAYSQYANKPSAKAGKPPADFIFDPSRNYNSCTHPDLFLLSYQGDRVLVGV